MLDGRHTEVNVKIIHTFTIYITNYWHIYAYLCISGTSRKLIVCDFVFFSHRILNILCFHSISQWKMVIWFSCLDVKFIVNFGSLNLVYFTILLVNQSCNLKKRFVHFHYEKVIFDSIFIIFYQIFCFLFLLDFEIKLIRLISIRKWNI